MSKSKSITVRATFSFNELDSGVRLLYDELKLIEANSSTKNEAVKAQRFHLLNVLRAYSLSNFDGVHEARKMRDTTPTLIGSRTNSSPSDIIQSTVVSERKEAQQAPGESPSFLSGNPEFKPE